MPQFSSPRVSLDLSSLRAHYAAGELTPRDVVETVLARVAALDDPAVFTHLFGREAIEAQLAALDAARGAGADLPLFGVPFAVKDNIDVGGVPTTAACPAFAYTAARSATAVTRLRTAGAICVGKTNLDQFATGLVGTRSPYGVPRNAFNPDYVPGGSSSGSAVAVAAGLVCFALGTDTAGSGRVPAAFNNLVGLKPTRGVISTAGVVPACRSLDCVSVFALTCADAAAVFRTARGADPADPFSRTIDLPGDFDPARFRLGVPRPDQLEFFGDLAAAAAFAEAARTFQSLGGRVVEIDFAPFAQAARLLYEGPWLAERYLVVRDLLAKDAGALLDVTRSIIARGGDVSGPATFEGLYRLAELRARTLPTWSQVDCLLLPTTPTVYTRAQVDADPITTNTRLGYYTNFVNLLDLSALALPAGFRPDGMPTGVTLVAPAGADEALLQLGDRFQQATNLTMGATGQPLPPTPVEAFAEDRGRVHLAVVGAHLSGLPLNGQLLELGARRVRAARTAACYRLYALPNTVPAKPGMMRVAEGAGAAIEVEVWSLEAAAFGRFVAAIPSPLGVGSILLEDGTRVHGFLCEAAGVAGARDISRFGGWRNFIAAGASA